MEAKIIYRVLYINNNRQASERARMIEERIAYIPCKLTHESNLSKGLDLLMGDTPWDLVLFDCKVDDSGSVIPFLTYCKRELGIPFLCLTMNHNLMALVKEFFGEEYIIDGGTNLEGIGRVIEAKLSKEGNGNRGIIKV